MNDNIFFSLLSRELDHQKRMLEIVTRRAGQARKHVESMQGHLDIKEQMLQETRDDHGRVVDQALTCAPYMHELHLDAMERLTFDYARRTKIRMETYRELRRARNCVSRDEAEIANIEAKIAKLAIRIQQSHITVLNPVAA